MEHVVSAPIINQIRALDDVLLGAVRLLELRIAHCDATNIIRARSGERLSNVKLAMRVVAYRAKVLDFRAGLNIPHRLADSDCLELSYGRELWPIAAAVVFFSRSLRIDSESRLAAWA